MCRWAAISGHPRRAGALRSASPTPRPARGARRGRAGSETAPGGRSLLAPSGVDPSVRAHAHKAEALERDGVRLVIADSVDHRSWVLLTQGAGGGFEFERVFFR